MALKDTIKQMHNLLAVLSKDLIKAERKKNKAASQRVRTGSIKFAKIAKRFRKESVADEKRGGYKKKKKATKKRKVGKKKRKPAKKRKVAKKRRPAPKRRKKAKKSVKRKKRRR